MEGGKEGREREGEREVEVGGKWGSAGKCNLFAVARIKRAALTFD